MSRPGPPPSRCFPSRRCGKPRHRSPPPGVPAGARRVFPGCQSAQGTDHQQLLPGLGQDVTADAVVALADEPQLRVQPREAARKKPRWSQKMGVRAGRSRPGRRAAAGGRPEWVLPRIGTPEAQQPVDLLEADRLVIREARFRSPSRKTSRTPGRPGRPAPGRGACGRRPVCACPTSPPSSPMKALAR